MQGHVMHTWSSRYTLECHTHRCITRICHKYTWSLNYTLVQITYITPITTISHTWVCHMFTHTNQNCHPTQIRYIWTIKTTPQNFRQRFWLRRFQAAKSDEDMIWHKNGCNTMKTIYHRIYSVCDNSCVLKWKVQKTPKKSRKNTKEVWQIVWNRSTKPTGTYMYSLNKTEKSVWYLCTENVDVIKKKYRNCL